MESQAPISHLSHEEDGRVDAVREKQPHVKRKPFLNPQLRYFLGVASVLIGVPLCIMAGVNYSINNLFTLVTVTVTSFPTNAVSTTLTSPPTMTNTLSPTETSISPTPTLGIGSTMTDKDGMTLLYVPAGAFTMGSESGSDDEKPIHTVTLDAFWIDQTEVTNKMYSLCVQAGVCKEPTSNNSYTRFGYYSDVDYDNYPVIYVDWNMAKAYCEWVDRRLPTEAEWEKAARGEGANNYPWGNDAPKNNLLNYNYNLDDTAEVGKYPKGASMYGAFDMAGNVWEWVSSLYKPYPYDIADGRESFTSSGSRVLRGGSWSDQDYEARSANRYGWHSQSFTNDKSGFRCSRSP